MHSKEKSPSQAGKGSVARRTHGKRVSSGRWSQSGSLLIQSRLGSLQAACPGGQGPPNQLVVLPKFRAPLDESLLPLPESIFPGGKPAFPPGKIPLAGLDGAVWVGARVGGRKDKGRRSRRWNTGTGMWRRVPGSRRLSHGITRREGNLAPQNANPVAKRYGPAG